MHSCHYILEVADEGLGFTTTIAAAKPMEPKVAIESLLARLIAVAVSAAEVIAFEVGATKL